MEEKRKLKDEWNIETSKDIRIVYSLDFEKEMKEYFRQEYFTQEYFTQEYYNEIPHKKVVNLPKHLFEI